MFESRYSKFLTVLLVIIIVAVIGLLGYLGYNYYNNYKTKNDSDKYVSTFIEEAGDENTTQNTTTDENTNIEGIEGNGSSNSSTSTKKKKTYKGFNVIGTIQIPKTNVNYPILEFPPSIKKLDTSIVALYPENKDVNTPGNIVLQGHNYRNGLFFSNNKKLSNGDKIYITGLDNKKVTYVIYKIYETQQNDTSCYNRGTDGAMEITLSTCTDATNDMRLVIQAKAE